MMGITTFSGDDGKTSLLHGDRVWKDDPRIEVLGAIDELDCQLAEALLLVGKGEEGESLNAARTTLARISGIIAGAESGPRAGGLREVADRLTDRTERYERETPINDFVVTGSVPASAKLDLCRAVARRAERRTVTLLRSGVADPNDLLLIGIYLNRLADFLFMAARVIEAGEGKLVFRSRKQEEEEERD